MGRLPRQGSVEVVTEASPEAVWRIMGNPTRVGAWSHETQETAWIDGATEAAPGARFVGRNRVRRFAWTRTSEILAVEPERELAWRTVPGRLVSDSTEWRIRLEPVDGGTRITQTYRVLKLNPVMDRLFFALLPEHRDRTTALRGDLERIGRAACEVS